MNIQKQREELIVEIEQFKTEAMKMHFVECWSETYRTDPFGYSIDDDNTVIWMKAQARQLWDFWKASQANPSQKGQSFFSHDFNGDGFRYHSTLDEARKEAEASLDWYRNEVADGRHVNDIGEFDELCYGVVLEQAQYSVDNVVTQKDVDSGESRHAVGTEILSLFLGAENA